MSCCHYCHKDLDTVVAACPKHLEELRNEVISIHKETQQYRKTSTFIRSKNVRTVALCHLCEGVAEFKGYCKEHRPIPRQKTPSTYNSMV